MTEGVFGLSALCFMFTPFHNNVRCCSSSHSHVTYLPKHCIKSVWSRHCCWILRQFASLKSLFSLRLFCTFFLPLLFILCYWGWVFKNRWILHRSLEADSLGSVPIPPRPLISQLPLGNNPWLSCVYSPPQTIRLFLKKRPDSLQTVADFCGMVPQRNLFHSSALLKHEMRQTCLWQCFAESLLWRAFSSQQLFPSPGLHRNTSYSSNCLQTLFHLLYWNHSVIP